MHLFLVTSFLRVVTSLAFTGDVDTKGKKLGQDSPPVGDGCRVARTYLSSPGAVPDLLGNLGHAFCIKLQWGHRI